MGFLVSPGVHVKEIDLTNVIPAVSTSIGAIAGPFEKGPVSVVTAINSEEQLIQTFGKPDGSNFEWWFTAANFLQYADALRVVRAESGILNAGANSGILIRDDDHYEASFPQDKVLMVSGLFVPPVLGVTQSVWISVLVPEHFHSNLVLLT